MQVSFTERYLNSLLAPQKRDRWETDSRVFIRGCRLMLRICPSGAKIWYARIRLDGKDRRVHLGLYLRSADPGHMSLDDARKAAHAALIAAREGSDHPGAVATREPPEPPLVSTPSTASTARGQDTVADVVANYVNMLLSQKKNKSAGQVKSAFKLGIADLFPHIAAMDASLLTSEQATDVIRRGMEKGRSRPAAGKLLSVMQTAYTVAMSSATNPNVAKSESGLGILINPFTAVQPVKGSKNARTRVISDYELRALMLELTRQTPVVSITAIELLIRCGGQRSAQLLRLKRADVMPNLSSLELKDGKGNRDQPRKHLVPTLPRVVELLTRQLEIAKILDSEFILTSNGKHHLNPQTVIDYFRTIVEKVQAEDSAIGYFTLSDVRRTAETWLSSQGVPVLARAHLLSHGLSGVQNRHYDMYEYFKEKREALERWNGHLDSLLAGYGRPAGAKEDTEHEQRCIPETMQVDRELFERIVLPHLLGGVR